MINQGDTTVCGKPQSADRGVLEVKVDGNSGAASIHFGCATNVRVAEDRD